MTAHALPERSDTPSRGRRAWKPILVAFVIGIAGAYYATGRLDYALYPVGLNLHTCARNGFGATFCGSDLTAYDIRIRGVQQQLQQTQRTLAQQAQAAQSAAKQAECQADPALAFCAATP